MRAETEASATETARMRAALYGRASSDPKKRGRSIKDQFADGELECEDRDWDIVGYYEDRDRSASRTARKKREDYERLVADMEAGLIDVVVYAERSRANRDMDNAIKLRKLCERTGVKLCYSGRIYDMSQPADRRDFTRDSVASEEESEAIRFRSLRTARLNAKRGAPHGKIPFGYTRQYDPDDGHLVGQVPHPQHAAVVLDLFQRADRHESFGVLEGILAQHMPLASRTRVRYILMNRTYIGERGWHGTFVKATWDPIVPVELFQRVQAIVTDESRRTHRDVRATHRLSGIATCYKCLEEGRRRPYLTRRKALPGKGARERYCCKHQGHVTISLDALDACVEEGLLAWMATPAFAEAFTPAAEDDGERIKVEEALEALQLQLTEARTLAGKFNDRNEPMLSIMSLARLEENLGPQIARCEKRLRQLTVVGDPVLDRLLTAAPEQIQEIWDRLTIPQVRHVLRRCVNVRLNKAARRGIRGIEPGRVVLTFASDPGFVEHSNRWDVAEVD
jgi:site-specific DNA recombinase